MKKILLRAVHFYHRIERGIDLFPKRKRNFGYKIAVISFIDSIFPPEKSKKYITTIEKYVDDFTKNLTSNFKDEELLNIIENNENNSRWNLWCCWWQGKESMPELVKMCNYQLKKMIDNQDIDFHLITLENYKKYVTIPKEIILKFEKNEITMTEMSDILRVNLLYEYGGIWLDATVFLTQPLDPRFINSVFFTQKMFDPDKWKHEACKGKWCGFIVSGAKNNPIFKYLNECFVEWWKNYDCVIDYVIYDYFLLSLYKKNSLIKELIDNMEDNNIDVFDMYKYLNHEYTDKLWNNLIKRTSMHKLTYKMDLYKTTDDGQDTLYNYLLRKVFGDNYV